MIYMRGFNIVTLFPVLMSDPVTIIPVHSWTVTSETDTAVLLSVVISPYLGHAHHSWSFSLAPWSGSDVTEQHGNFVICIPADAIPTPNSRFLFVKGGGEDIVFLPFALYFQYPYLCSLLLCCSPSSLSNVSFLCSWGGVGWDKEKEKEAIWVWVMWVLTWMGCHAVLCLWWYLQWLKKPFQERKE